MPETASGSATIAKSGLRLFEGAYEISYDSLFEHDETIPASTTNKRIPVPMVFANLVGIAVYGDQDFTLKTEDGAVPEQTFTFKAKKPLLWMKDDPRANPITTDHDDWYVTTGAIPAALNLQVVLLFDVP